MKNIIILSAAITLAAFSAQAQGKVNFSNSSSTRISTNMVAGGPAFGVTAPASFGKFRFALYYSTSATSVNGQTAAINGTASSNYAFNDANWTLVGYGSNFLTAGQFITDGGPGAAPVTIPGVAVGAAARFVVIGWSSANAGSTAASLQSWFNGGSPVVPGLIGQSVVSGLITLSTNTTLFGTSSPLVQGFVLGVAAPGAGAPVITSQPANATLPQGANATFSVGVYGASTLAYQWMFNGATVISGATNASLTIQDIQPGDGGTYSAVITNSLGSTNSFAATLTVNPPTNTGYVVFANTSASVTRISTNSAVGGPATGLTVAGGNVYRYALFASTNTTMVSGGTAAIVGAASTGYAFSDPNWTLVAYGSNGTNTTTNGLYLGEVVNLSATSGRTAVTGFGAGVAVRFVVVGWSAGIGSDIATVQSWFNAGSPASNGWIGESAVSGALTLGDGGVVPTPQLFGASAPYLQGFTLGLASPVPGAAYASAPPAVVQTSLSGNLLKLSWPSAAGSFGLQSAPSPTGPWSDLNNAVSSDGTTSSVTVTAPAANTFYRVVEE